MRIAPLFLLVLAGCSTTSAQTASPLSQCIDATRQVHDFQVESSTSVVIEQAPGRVYRVTLARDCPNLLNASGVSLANGIPRQVGYRDGRPLWANTVSGGSRICGRAGDRLMLRDTFEDFSRPMQGCSIASVERLSPR